MRSHDRNRSDIGGGQARTLRCLAPRLVPHRYILLSTRRSHQRQGGVLNSSSQTCVIRGEEGGNASNLNLSLRLLLTTIWRGGHAYVNVDREERLPKICINVMGLIVGGNHSSYFGNLSVLVVCAVEGFQ